MLVTAKKWYMPRRVYGRVVGGNARNLFIQGSFGLESFDRSTVREVHLTTHGADRERMRRRRKNCPYCYREAKGW